MPGSSGAIRAGRAFVEINTDTSALSAGLSKAEARFKRWGESVSKTLAKAGQEIRKFGAEVQELGKHVMEGGIAISAAFTAMEMTFAHAGTEMKHAADSNQLPRLILSSVDLNHSALMSNKYLKK